MSPSSSLVLNFEHEVRSSERQLLRMAQNLMGSEADAWDAYQEALIRAYTRLTQYRGDSRFSTWLYRILYHTCYDELRRRRRRPLPLGFPTPPGNDAVRPEAHTLPTPMDQCGAPDPAALAEQREMQQTIRRAVGHLSQPYREIVQMRELDGLTYEEISSALRLPPGTVKSRLNRARARLKRHLQCTPA